MDIRVVHEAPREGPLEPVAYDDSELTREEMLAMAERAFNDADTVGPIE